MNMTENPQISELNQPQLFLRLEGEMGQRIQANLDNWLYPCPKVNPGLLEMFRMRDRAPKPKVTMTRGLCGGSI